METKNAVQNIVRVCCGDYPHVFINRFTESFPSLQKVAASDLLLALDGDQAAVDRINVALDEGDGLSGNGDGWRGRVEVGARRLELHPYVEDRFLVLQRQGFELEIYADFTQRPSLHVASNLAHGYGSKAHHFFTLDDQGGEVEIENVLDFIEGAQKAKEELYQEEEKATQAYLASLPRCEDAEDEDDLSAATLIQLRANSSPLIFEDDEE